MLKTALVVKGKSGIDIFRFLQQCGKIEIVGLACADECLELLSEDERKKFFITTDIEKISALPEAEIIFNTTGDAMIQQRLSESAGSQVRLEELTPRSILSSIIDSREQYMETRLLKGELLAILNSVQDPIEVADAKGVVKYVNPAFTRVTGIPERERVNKNIFDVSPQGALAQSLIQQKPITGYRTYVGGSDADVVSNASPIIVDGELFGAVVVFQPVSDILKLMDELKHSNTIIENLYAQLDQISGSHWTFEGLTGQSKPFKAAVEAGRRAARSDAPVLISGESGSGKSLFAQAIHNSSTRKNRPFIIFDCSAVPDSLQELELFGCEKGAMPGIVRTRLGRIELAGEGILFLKEITSLTPYLQNKILELLESGSFKRIGGDHPIASQVRLIVSAGDNLRLASLKGYFSEELYRRLSQLEIALPPLRKRLDDIPLLVEALMARLNRKLGKNVMEVSPRALQELSQYDWPGNISELRNAIERAMVVTDGSVIEYHHLSPYIGRLSSREAPAIDDIVPLDRMEEMMLKLALTRYGDSLEGKKKAAQALNISLATLYNKLKKYSS